VSDPSANSRVTFAFLPMLWPPASMGTLQPWKTPIAVVDLGVNSATAGQTDDRKRVTGRLRISYKAQAGAHNISHDNPQSIPSLIHPHDNPQTIPNQSHVQSFPSCLKIRSLLARGAARSSQFRLPRREGRAHNRPSGTHFTLQRRTRARG
jgi:hypothetical protein